MSAKASKAAKLAKLEALAAAEAQADARYRVSCAPELPVKANSPTIQGSAYNFASGSDVPCRIQKPSPGFSVRQSSPDENRVCKESAARENSQQPIAETWEWNRKIDETREAPSARSFSVNIGLMDEIRQYERYFNIQSWNFWDLPILEFESLTNDAIIRMGPGQGAVLRSLAIHEKVKGVLETFDGWVKLADGPGWVCRSSDGIDFMRPLSEPKVMAVPELCASAPRRRMFEIIAEPSLPILEEPLSNAKVKDFRWCGQFLLAETQTYHGWVCVAETGGWMQYFSEHQGQLLCSVSPLEHADSMLESNDAESENQQRKEQEELAILQQLDEQEREEAHEALRLAADGSDREAFNVALKLARQRGVAKKEIARLHALFTMDA